MVEFLKNHQLNIMMSLGSICLIIALFVLITKTLSKRRKKVLILLEISSAVLLFSDRFAYIYRGDVSNLGFYMVRISNYLVFASTLMIIHAVNLYLADLITHEGGETAIPKRLRIGSALVVTGQLLLIVSQFTGLYYTFDETNHYHRAPLYVICYVIPLLVLFLQLSVTIGYYKHLGRLIRIALLFFSVAPAVASVMQFFLYGLSLTNIAIVGMAVVLYIMVLVDANDMVERAHKIELESMQGENARMQKLFDQTATAFVSAVERKDMSIQGCSTKVAEYARRIAQLNGMDEEECKKAYYAGLLHNIGLMGIPDNEIFSDGDDPERTKDITTKMADIGNEILSNIKEMPYLSVGAHYCHEKYNGTGFPEGLEGDDIPEIARIIAVADAYVLMKTDSTFSRNMPDFVVREELLKGEGEAFDPKFAELMIKILDEDGKDKESEKEKIETLVTCEKYRDQITTGIPIEYEATVITFDCKTLHADEDGIFSAPAIILFDSYDWRVHDNARAIEAYKYIEYGELWFDSHSIQTEARKLQESVKRRDDIVSSGDDFETYEIRMGRYEDHLKLMMISPLFEKEVIVALPNGSKGAFIAITGENCEISNISVRGTGQEIGQDELPRIVSITSYIDRMESDIKNIQIDRPRSGSTEGIELIDRLRINFHTMSLLGASFVWHCPYIVLFYSEDGKVYGKNYREYGLVKIYGENEGDNDFAHNSINMRKTDEFPGWDAWKEINKEGLECEVTVRRKDNRIVIKTKNLGIEMENTTTLMDSTDKVYVALTGDQVAITDIRIR